jgi:putative tricarboxylic transport membrane protein
MTWRSKVRIRIRSQQDLAAGLLFLGFAAAGLWISSDYPLGTAVRMSSGYFPRILCIALAVLGICIIAQSLIAEGRPISRISIRPVVLIPVSVLLFALSINTLGLVVASILIVIVGSLASAQTRWREMLIAALVLSAAAVMIFVKAIGLLLPIWPEL